MGKMATKEHKELEKDLNMREGGAEFSRRCGLFSNAPLTRIDAKHRQEVKRDH
jgi:hypothetical protein